MDKHWRRLLTAKGGAPGWIFSDGGESPLEKVRCVRRPARGRPAIYEDIDGVRFTLMDLREATGLESPSSLRYRVDHFPRWSDMVDPFGRGVEAPVPKCEE